MKLAFVLLALTALFQGNFIGADDVPASSSISRAIVIPHLVEFSRSGHHYCSGALIGNMKTVITVPPCFDSISNDEIANVTEIIAGSTTIQQSRIRDIVFIPPHVVLINLSEPFTPSEEISRLSLADYELHVLFDNGFVFDVACRLVCRLLTHSKHSLRNITQTGESLPAPYYYPSAHLPLTLKRSCKELSSVDDNHLYFCAEILSYTYTIPCEIDIGTPLSINRKLIGLVSQKINDTYVVLDTSK